MPGLCVGAIFSIGRRYWAITTYDLVYSLDNDMAIL